MDKMADTLGRLGAWCAQNKYLSAIKNAFQNFMPLTIAGAAGLLWTQVLVNDNIVEGNAQGLGGIFPPIMALEFLNPAFDAIFFATISCITIGITFGIANEIGIWNLGADKAGYFPGILGIAAWLTVTETAHKFFDANAAETTFTAISSDALGATGLFTGMIFAVLSVELFCFFAKMDGLKIKMPDTVPPGVSRAFEVLIPAFIVLVITSMIGLASVELLGNPVNAVIKTAIAEPLTAIGASIPGVIVIYTLIMLFWLVGIHGNNMLAAVKESIFTPLLVANTEAFKAGKTPENVWNIGMLQMFGEFGGSGVTIGLVIAIFIFSKRADNRAIASLSIVPGLFNINETVTFGIPMVLNPILGIPFLFTATITLMIGYFLTTVGFCPPAVLPVPWTTPPILLGYLATGAQINGAISQVICIIVSVFCYVPFLMAYEKYQNKQAAE